jgi:hypothetical protein
MKMAALQQTLAFACKQPSRPGLHGRGWLLDRSESSHPRRATALAGNQRHARLASAPHVGHRSRLDATLSTAVENRSTRAARGGMLHSRFVASCAPPSGFRGDSAVLWLRGCG